MKSILLYPLLFLALWLFPGARPSDPPLPVEKPNIILIYADDLGYGELGCYGQRLIKTPHLDQLAAEGMRFTQFYAGAPVCAPSRCMLLTGRHSGHSYIRGNYELGGYGDNEEGGQMPLPEGTFTAAKLLKNAGYATAMCGKWGLGMARTSGSPLQQGFDYYYGCLDQKQAHNYYPTHLWENDLWDTLDNRPFFIHQKLDSATAKPSDFDQFIGREYAPELMTRHALDFIKMHEKAPFFLYLSYPLPHVGLQVPPEELAQYKGVFDEHPYYGQKGYNPCAAPLSTYAAMISYLDAQVGIIMAQLKAAGLDDNTLVLFSSDNGPTFAGGVNPKFLHSAGGLRGLKMDLYEGGIRVPFIARWPGKIAAGTTQNMAAAQYDMLATFADLTQQKLEVTDGISLLPVLTGDAAHQQQHEFFYFEYPENGGQLAIRYGDWKGLRRNVFKNPQAPWELYRLDADVGETTDVAAKHPEIIAKMNEIADREHWVPHITEWKF